MYSIPQLARKYFRYYATAANSKGHGVHSPFVFDFIKFIKNDRQQYSSYSLIEQCRKKLLGNSQLIEVQDFGAGSTVIKTNQRNINAIAASSLKPKKFAQLFHRMVRAYQPSNIIELGTSFGISTAYMATAAPNAAVYSLEGAPAIAKIAQQNFDQLGTQNIQLIPGDFTDTLPQLLQTLDGVDFAYVDGNHRQAPTIDYFNQLMAKSHENTVIIFDDIHWSAEMEAAWEIIKGHEAVTLSIDLFFIGIVFFKKDFKAKQHFILRF
jgi:predicted O-methyltransferase YrrM